MLRDRRPLLEQDIVKLKQAAGQLYLRIVTGQADANDNRIYANLKEQLSDKLADLTIINQMIQDGHQ